MTATVGTDHATRVLQLEEQNNNLKRALMMALHEKSQAKYYSEGAPDPEIVQLQIPKSVYSDLRPWKDVALQLLRDERVFEPDEVGCVWCLQGTGILRGDPNLVALVRAHILACPAAKAIRDYFAGAAAASLRAGKDDVDELLEVVGRIVAFVRKIDDGDAGFDLLISLGLDSQMFQLREDLQAVDDWKEGRGSEGAGAAANARLTQELEELAPQRAEHARLRSALTSFSERWRSYAAKSYQRAFDLSKNSETRAGALARSIAWMHAALQLDDLLGLGLRDSELAKEPATLVDGSHADALARSLIAAKQENIRLRGERDSKHNAMKLAAESADRAKQENTRLRSAVESMAGALRDAAALIDSARALAIHNGNAASERAFEAGKAAADAAVPVGVLIDVLAASDKPTNRQRQQPPEAK